MMKREIKPVIHTRADGRRDDIEIDEKGNIKRVFRKPDRRYKFVKGGRQLIREEHK